MIFYDYTVLRIKRLLGRQGEGFIATLAVFEGDKYREIAHLMDAADGGAVHVDFRRKDDELALEAKLVDHPDIETEHGVLQVDLDLWILALVDEVQVFNKAKRARSTKTFVQSKSQFKKDEWNVISRPWREPLKTEFVGLFVLNPNDLRGYLARFSEVENVS